MEISPKKLITALMLVFFLGILFSIINGYYTQEEGTTLPLIVYAISFISLILGGSIMIMFQWKINKIQINRILKILPKPEKKIIEILIENNNSIEQNKLVALSGYNKVKISRILQELEQREVIKKINSGNTNLIILKI